MISNSEEVQKEQEKQNNQENIPSQGGEGKHKTVATCLNNCIEWKLKASVSNNQKNSTSASYIGASYFFKQLDASVLNILQNSSSTASNFNSTMKNLVHTSKSQLKDKFSSGPYAPEILKIKFPIDNTTFSFMIIDANLGIKENLNNIFFLEFDLANSDFGSSKIREINDDCVEKDINFSLNATFHDVPLFKSDLIFSVEYRKFIKSIQFRLQNYKNQILKQGKYTNGKYIKNYRKNTDPNQGGSSITFYAKILSNINIGIEFTKPVVEEYELFHTNFNSIVNSNIKINKIYLEVCIPKIFIEGKNINLGKMKLKSNEEQKVDEKEKETTVSDSTSNANSTNNGSDINNNTKPYQNDFERMLYKQHNSPSMTIRNNLTLNGKFHPSGFYGSPPLSLKPPQGLNPPHIMYTPMSPMIPNPYYSGLIGQPGLGIGGGLGNPPINPNPRKFSENVLEKLRENPLSKMTHQMPQIPPLYSSQTPVLMRMTKEDFISSVPIQPFISPRGMSTRTSVGSVGSPTPGIPMGPMFGTIHKRILDWENKGNEFGHFKNNMMPNMIQNKKNMLELALKKHYFEYNKNKTNFDIFISTVTPNYSYCDEEEMKKLSLFSFFSFWKKISIFGLRATYYMNREFLRIVYFCTLSSMQITVSNKEVVDKIIEYLKTSNKLTKDLNDDEHVVIPDIIQNLQVNVSKTEVVISFYENKPGHFRLTFITQLNLILSSIPPLKSITLDDLNRKNSWFSLLLFPLKAAKSLYSNKTSFIVYYPIDFPVVEKKEKESPKVNESLSVIGILPIKFEPKFFFTRSNLNGFVIGIDEPSTLFNSLVNNVQEKIIKNVSRISYDYENYLKLNNEIIYK